MLLQHAMLFRLCVKINSNHMLYGVCRLGVRVRSNAEAVNAKAHLHIRRHHPSVAAV